jgi:hypothetical protein
MGAAAGAGVGMATSKNDLKGGLLGALAGGTAGAFGPARLGGGGGTSIGALQSMMPATGGTSIGTLQAMMPGAAQQGGFASTIDAGLGMLNSKYEGLQNSNAGKVIGNVGTLASLAGGGGGGGQPAAPAMIDQSPIQVGNQQGQGNEEVIRLLLQMLQQGRA